MTCHVCLVSLKCYHYRPPCSYYKLPSWQYWQFCIGTTIRTSQNFCFLFYWNETRSTFVISFFINLAKAQYLCKLNWYFSSSIFFPCWRLQGTWTWANLHSFFFLLTFYATTSASKKEYAIVQNYQCDAISDVISAGMNESPRATYLCATFYIAL